MKTRAARHELWRRVFVAADKGAEVTVMKPITTELLSTIFVVGLALAQAGDDTNHVRAGPAVPDTDVAKKSGSLSDKLNSSNGVIHPRGSTGPTMQKPAIANDPMPNIPPPSSSGRSPAQPK